MPESESRSSTIGAGQEFHSRIAADIAKWSRIVEAAGIKPN
jgi:tripartite-type tricarboxylate transporter receptor subunit TctC